MGKRCNRLLFAGAIAAALLACSCPPAWGVKPIDGGRYAGRVHYGGHGRSHAYHATVAFNVDDRGEKFSSDYRVYLEGSWLSLPCSGREQNLGGSHPVVIHPDGSFSFAGAISYRHTPRGLRLRLSGRFIRSGTSATGSFREIAKPRRGRRCRGTGTFVAKFTGQRHLAVGSCTPPGSTTITDDGVYRVYREVYVYDPVVRALGSNAHAIYACDRRTQRRWTLLLDDDSYTLIWWAGGSEHLRSDSLVRLSGDLVGLAYTEETGGSETYGAIEITDLRSGRKRLVVLSDDCWPKMGALCLAGAPGDSDREEVRSFVLQPTGSAAWITCLPDSKWCAVVKEESYGDNVVLAHGRHIAQHSLTLTGTTVSWLRNGATETATLK